MNFKALLQGQTWNHRLTTFVQGNWIVHVDVRNNNSGEAERLFCIEGDLDVRRRSTEHSLLRRTLEATLPSRMWALLDDAL